MNCQLSKREQKRSDFKKKNRKGQISRMYITEKDRFAKTFARSAHCSYSDTMTCENAIVNYFGHQQPSTLSFRIYNTDDGPVKNGDMYLCNEYPHSFMVPS